MAKQGIITGTTPNDGLGDSLLSGAIKINSNFSEIYNAFGNGTNLVSYANTSGIASSLSSTVNINTTGIITAASFSGDGSALTGIVGSGSGVIVKDSGSLVGTAGTIDFGDNLTVSAISAGIVTVTASGGSSGIATYATNAGIATYATNAGVATYATVAGIATYATSAGISTYATNAGVATYATVAGIATYATSAGISTYATNAGIATSVIGGIASVTQLNVSGVSTFVGNAIFQSDINLGDNDKIIFGNSTDIQIYHDGTDSRIVNGTGDLILKTDLTKSIIFQDGSSDVLAQFTSDGPVKLYHNNSIKFETTGYGATVFGTLESQQLNVTGVATATSFRSNSTTGNGTDVGFAIKYYITSSGFSAYRFAGPGVVNTTDNPTFYLHRGFTYIFENSTGGSHPFAIRYSSGGTGYGSTYLSGSQSGTQVFTVPFDAPATLVYQCTIHGGMLGTFNIVT
jgi:hypothetical protein